MTVKKVFAEIYEFLAKNKGRRVEEIFPQLEELMSPRKGTGSNATNVIKDEKGNIRYIFCYYHKKWEDPKVAEYGEKKGTATGLNTMCKEGVRMWTKQHNEAKKQKEELLAKVAAGTLKTEQLAAELQKIEAAAKKIIPRADGHGFDEPAIK